MSLFKMIGVSLLGLGSAAAGIIVNSPAVPPDGAPYTKDGGGFISYGGGVILIPGMTFSCGPEVPAGPDVNVLCTATTTAQIQLGANPISTVVVIGPGDITLFNKAGLVTGTFNTEMLSLNLTGVDAVYGRVRLTESAGLASLGQSTILGLGGGQFQIDSFFDVFTTVELLDLGLTFNSGSVPGIPGSDRILLAGRDVPEPGTIALFLLGAGLVAGLKRLLARP
ncbi:MAG: PEP-CTERM sorting domain-containing protein [Acidobacteria bacterium]|nr:PEP-CTERM sorting domain-containing protein [Acidobacteriota bacterium]